MENLIIIIVILTIMLAGCSSVNKSMDNISQRTANTIIIEITDNNKQQPLLGDESKNSKDNNSNTNSNLLGNIDTFESQFEKGYYDYHGNINNNIIIQMSIYPLEKRVVGSYFYDEERKEIELKGEADKNNIILYEYDDTGKNTGTFQGTMDTVDKIVGTWTNPDGKSGYPFTLSLKNILPGIVYGKRYGISEGDQVVEDFLAKIQGYIVNNNKEQLAEQIMYPINVKVNGKFIKMQNKDDFIKNYDQIIYPDFSRSVSSAFTKYLFANSHGIMFGNEMYNIWVNEVVATADKSKLMITSINN